MEVTAKIKGVLEEVSQVIYDAQEDFETTTYDEYLQEYVSQVENNQYGFLLNYLWFYHRKYYFKLSKVIKEGM